MNTELIIRINEQDVVVIEKSLQETMPIQPIDKILEKIANVCPGSITYEQNGSNKKFIIHVSMCIIGESVKNSLRFGNLNGDMQTIFEKQLLLQCRNFADDVVFQKCIFKSSFSIVGCHFSKDALFDECEFEGSLIAAKSTFERKVSFWNASFKQILNLSGTSIIQSNLANFVNIKMEQSFKKLEMLVERENSSNPDYKQNIPKDLRDSYRVVKNALIQQNNILDASLWHKLELYSKEIELDSKKSKTPSEWIDRILLGFYRITSDHHTDVLKSLHSLLVVIGIFGLLSGVIVFAFNACHLGYFSPNPHALMENYNAHIRHFTITSAYCIVAWNIILLLVFVGSFVLSVLCGHVRKFCVGIGYFVSIALLLTSPKYLIPASGLFTGERAALDPLSVVGGIYTILFAFMLYSFIKTIRKNSIIPS